jgi:hypothetical protein
MFSQRRSLKSVNMCIWRGRMQIAVHCKSKTRRILTVANTNKRTCKGNTDCTNFLSYILRVAAFKIIILMHASTSLSEKQKTS